MRVSVLMLALLTPRSAASWSSERDFSLRSNRPKIRPAVREKPSASKNTPTCSTNSAPSVMLECRKASTVWMGKLTFIQYVQAILNLESGCFRKAPAFAPRRSRPAAPDVGRPPPMPRLLGCHHAGVSAIVLLLPSCAPPLPGPGGGAPAAAPAPHVKWTPPREAPAEQAQPAPAIPPDIAERIQR